MHGLEAFPEIIKTSEALAPYVNFKIGGPVEVLVQPRSREELSAVVKHCFKNNVPLRVLGGGCNVLVRDEGVKGAVLRLSAPAFTTIDVQGQRVKAGAGAPLSVLISQAARNSLGGLEALVGIQGTIGGAVHCNAGDRSGEIGHFTLRVEVMDRHGLIQVRERDELRFAVGTSNIDDPVLLSAEFELEKDDADAIVKRMRRAWIQRKARQPLTFQAAARIFKNPRGLAAGALIEQAGLAKMRVGGAEISDRDPNFIVAHPEATARDVLRLIDVVKSRVLERFNVELELEIAVW
ncbi:MAG: UDP-N-acetylmuramate dehydrogenase [Gemmataceae bacterium]